MKKIILLFISLLFCLTVIGCNKNNESKTSKETYYSNPFEPIDYDYPYIESDKFLYELDDTIVVNAYNADDSDYIALFDYDGEPDDAVPHKRIKIGNSKSVSFSIADLGLTAGDYAICIYQNKTFYLYDRIEIQIDDEDKTDYKINSATFTAKKEKNVHTVSITIYPSTDKELTYTLYWCKDGKRLEEYTDLKRVVEKNALSGFTINFNENMFMPNDANQIEVAITEGNSTSYFIDVDDTLKLEQSKYIYNFQVLTDIHANPDYGFWSSHLYRALNDVKCLSGNTSGIFTVGDNTDMGSSSHYEHLSKIINSVFGDNVPEIYYTVGNHDYMYFSDHLGGFDLAIDYFKLCTGMENSYYTKEVNGYKYIFLSSDEKSHEGDIYEDQMNWFKEELAKIDKNEFAFIFIHQPLYNTVSGSLVGQNWYCMPTAGDEIKTLLKDYPNVLVFSGHTHNSLESYKTTSFGHGLNANYVNNAAIAYLINDADDYTVGGQCNFIEVYEDYIIIKGRDLYEGKWVSSAQFVCYLY